MYLQVDTQWLSTIDETNSLSYGHLARQVPSFTYGVLVGQSKTHLYTPSSISVNSSP